MTNNLLRLNLDKKVILFIKKQYQNLADYNLHLEKCTLTCLLKFVFHMLQKHNSSILETVPS